MSCIPKKIHYCWLSGDPFPDLIKNCILSWKKNLPDYEFVLWDRQRFDILSVPWVKEAFDTRKYAFAADYIRLYALYNEGGIYLDADVEVLKSFNDLLDKPSFIGYEASGDLEPAVIGAASGCRWIADCLYHYQDRHFCLADGTLDMTPLPIIVEKILRSTGILNDKTPNLEPIVTEDLILYPPDFFSPKDVYSNNINSTPRTYAIHHFDGHWVEQTLSYSIKQIIHRVIHSTFGSVVHRRIVNTLRAIKK
jgi:mannosyltransferase OCH1-like enzyme